MVSTVLLRSAILVALLGTTAKANTNTCPCNRNLQPSFLECNNPSAATICTCTDPNHATNINCGSSYAACCTRRHRLIQSADEVFTGGVDKSEYHKYVFACGKYEYETYLFVDSHLYAAASPKKNAAVAAGCPYLVNHAGFDEIDGGVIVNNEILVWNDKTQGESNFGDSEAYPMGTFTLSELVRAF